MRRTVASFACALVSGVLFLGTGARPAHAAIAPEPDTAYCPYGSVTGAGSWSPNVDSNLSNHVLTITVAANCTGAGDESGFYSVTLTGSSLENCAGGDGSGGVSGVSPEGTMSGTFTFYKIGVHYYINGSYTAAGEPHTLQLWLDILPLASPCNYGAAPLIGHGAFADTPQVSGADVDTVDFTGSAAATVAWVGGSGTFTFSSNECEMASPPEVGVCAMNAAGTFTNIVCGTGTASGTASLTGPDGTETITFTITFSDGQGVVTGNAAEPDGNGTVSGWVDIAPNSPQAPPGVCTFGFSVIGHLTIV
jgi:hypothetical protein